MAYSFQTFTFKSVLTSAEMNQVEINIRDHVHGAAGVVTVPDTGLSSNVALKNTANSFTGDLTIKKAGAANLILDATTSSAVVTFMLVGVISARVRSSAINSLQFDDNTGTQKVKWDLSTGTLTLGNIPDARLTTNVALKNVTNVFTANQEISNVNPNIFFRDTDQGVNLKVYSIDSNSGAIRFVTFNDDLTGGTVQVSFDRTGTLTLGSIPDARLTTNVALRDINNSFSTSQSFIAVGIQLIANATTGDPQFIFQRGGVNAARITSTGASLISFKDASAVEKITFDMATGVLDTVGQVKIQGGVPGLNKVLTSDAAGLATWEVNPSAPFLNNGNVSGANRTLGNTDNFSLGFEVNNVTRINIPVTDNLNFNSIAGVQKVNWDLSGTNGKLTQGDVPWARMQSGNSTTSSNAGANSLLVSLPTLILDDLVMITYFASATKSSVAGMITYNLSRNSGLGVIKYGPIQVFSSNSHYAPASTSIVEVLTVVGVVTTAGTYTLNLSISGAVASQVLQIEVRIIKGT